MLYEHYITCWSKRAREVKDGKVGKEKIIIWMTMMMVMIQAPETRSHFTSSLNFLRPKGILCEWKTRKNLLRKKRSQEEWKEREDRDNSKTKTRLPREEGGFPLVFVGTESILPSFSSLFSLVFVSFFFTSFSRRASFLSWSHYSFSSWLASLLLCYTFPSILSSLSLSQSFIQRIWMMFLDVCCPLLPSSLPSSLTSTSNIISLRLKNHYRHHYRHHYYLLPSLWFPFLFLTSLQASDTPCEREQA